MIAFGHEVNGQTVYFFKANEDVMFLDETDNIIHAVDKNDKTECWFLRSNKRLAHHLLIMDYKSIIKMA